MGALYIDCLSVFRTLYSLQLVGSDASPIGFVVQLVINVVATVVDNPPVFRNLSNTFSISENFADGGEVGSIQVTDEGILETTYKHFINGPQNNNQYSVN